MRLLSPLRLFPLALLLVAPIAAAPAPAAPDEADVAMLRRIHDAALEGSPIYGRLGELVNQHPGRLAGSRSLASAIQWARGVLETQGVDRLEVQPVQVPHWERGEPERVALLPSAPDARPVPLAAVALGGSVATPPTGLVAPVVELWSLDALRDTDVRGKIVFFNRPMNPRTVTPGQAYGDAVDQRSRGPAEAARHGAVAVLIRSLTHSLDDHPHTGMTRYVPEAPRIPAAALSTLAADRLSRALLADPQLRVSIAIHARTLDDTLSHNVIAELRGTEFPEQVILVGGHLDSWDITPGAHDDGAGCVQAMEVLRLLRAAGHQPRHTIRCVLFTNEENGLRGALEYARVVGERQEPHVLALESDSGGFAPAAFQLGNTRDDAHERAARWLPLFEPYGIRAITRGNGGADVHPLMAKGYAVGQIIPEAQRYFNFHHTTIDTLDQVNPRELQLGAAALASLVYLVDRHGL